MRDILASFCYNTPEVITVRDIGKNIKDLRIGKNMTQDELAAKLFVTRQTVSNYETGRSRSDIDMLVKIADVLNVDIHDILYEPENIADRRKRILTVAVIAVVMAALGCIVMAFGEYADVIKTTTYRYEWNIIVRVYVQSAYFFLLGYLFTNSVRFLQKVRPIRNWAQAGIRYGVLVLYILLILLLLPHLTTVVLSLMNLPPISLPEWWCKISQNLLRIATLTWLNLFFGALLGVASNWDT